MEKTIFHLALNVTDLNEACDFYSGLLGAKQGRSTDTWMDFDFFGHQLSLHIGDTLKSEDTGKVDNVTVPIPHFGIILPLDSWKSMAKKLMNANIEFVIPPTIRFENQACEQYTMFFIDPFGNPLEFKSFMDMKEVFNT